MRTIVIVAVVGLATISCGTVEQMPPPSDFVSRASQDAPPPPPSIRDDEACKLFSWPLSAQQATEILKRTNMFTQTGIYYGGEPPPQIAAFNVLLDQAEPLFYIDDVARTGGSAGRLFALCANQLLDAGRHKRLATQLRADQTLVFAQFACIGMKETVSELVGVVEKNSYGRYFREARDRTYKYFDGPATICLAG